MIEEKLKGIINYAKTNKKVFLSASDIYIMGAFKPMFHFHAHNFPKDIDRMYDLTESFSRTEYTNYFELIAPCLTKLKVNESDIQRLSKLKSFQFITISINLDHFFQANELEYTYVYYVLFPFEGKELKPIVCCSNEHLNSIDILKKAAATDSTIQNNKVLEEYNLAIFQDVLDNLNSKNIDLAALKSIRVLFENILPKLSENEINQLVKSYSKTIKNPKKFILELEENGYIDKEILEEGIDKEQLNYEFLRSNITNYEDDWKIDINQFHCFIFENCNINVSKTTDLTETQKRIELNELSLLNLNSGLDRYNLIIVNKSKETEILDMASKLKIPLEIL